MIYPNILRLGAIAQEPVAYADAFAIAAAQELGGSVLTGDPEFETVEILIKIEWLDVKP